mmetsp:Transcript_4949/g.13089  ORF Transcript_4949/g.13089 Transcript_4949/m.13089 type:complete len:275 (-) Transcript_4949:318-1142(-)
MRNLPRTGCRARGPTAGTGHDHAGPASMQQVRRSGNQRQHQERAQGHRSPHREGNEAQREGHLPWHGRRNTKQRNRRRALHRAGEGPPPLQAQGSRLARRQGNQRQPGTHRIHVEDQASGRPRRRHQNTPWTGHRGRDPGRGHRSHHAVHDDDPQRGYAKQRQPLHPRKPLHRLPRQISKVPRPGDREEAPRPSPRCRHRGGLQSRRGRRILHGACRFETFRKGRGQPDDRGVRQRRRGRTTGSAVPAVVEFQMSASQTKAPTTASKSTQHNRT